VYGNEFGRTCGGINEVLQSFDHTEIGYCVFVEIYDENSLIYSSKNTLCRDEIIFKGLREVLPSDDLSGESLLFTKNIEDFRFTNCECHELPDMKDCYFVNAKEDYIIYKRESIFSTVNNNSNNVVSLDVEYDENCEFIFNGKRYSILLKFNNLIIKLGNEQSRKSIIVKLDNTVQNLSDYENNDGNKIFKMNLTISKNNPHSLVVYSSIDDKEIAKENFIIIDEFSYRFDKPFYFLKAEKTVFEISINGEKEIIDVEPNSQYARIPKFEGILIIKLPVIQCKLGDILITENKREFWYESIDSKCKLELTKIDAEINIILNDVVLRTLDDKYPTKIFDFGDNLRKIISDPQISIVDVKVRVIKPKEENVTEFDLLTIYSKPRFVGEVRIKYEEGKLLWNQPRFFGYESQLLLNLSSDNFLGEVSFDPKYALLSECNFLSDNLYKFKIIQKNDSFFSKNEFTLCKGSFIVGDPREFEFFKKRIKIQTIRVENISKELQYNTYVENIKYIGMQYDETDNGEFPIYEGNAYYINSYHERVVYSTEETNTKPQKYRFNPVHLLVINGITLYMSNDEKDGLFFDNKFKKLIDMEPTSNSEDRFMIPDYYDYKVEEEENV